MTPTTTSRSRGLRRACAVTALSVASACATASPDATVGEFAGTELCADVAATICAEVLRQAFPTADDCALTPGAPVFVHDPGSFTVAYGGHAPTVRYAGNARIALLPGGGALNPPRTRWVSTPSTTLPIASVQARVEVRSEDGRTRVLATGDLASPSLRARLRADLALAAAIEMAIHAVRRGGYEDARAALAPWIARESDLRPGRRWLARAHVIAAHLELADGDLGRARTLLGMALDHDADLLQARTELARLTGELAEDRARKRERRTLAALSGNGFAALGAVAHLPRMSAPRTPDDLSRVAQRLAAERAPAADIFRVAQQARDALPPGAQADALSVLATAAERLDQPRRAHEAHLARALLVGTTPDVVHSLSRTARALGDPARAASMLSMHWREIEGIPEARNELALALAMLSPEAAARALALGNVPDLAAPLLAECDPTAARALSRGRVLVPTAIAAPPR